MSEVICVTNRALCPDGFLPRMARIAAAKPRAVILREKDLDAAAYASLAQAVQNLCAPHGVPLVLSGRAALACRLGLPVQISVPALREAGAPPVPFGVSVHCPEEAAEAARAGASWLVAGHVWDTACKAGLPGRGEAFLRAAVQAAGTAPVYAIGGVTPARMPAVRAAGAAGACVMSALMSCADPAAYLAEFDC